MNFLRRILFLLFLVFSSVLAEAKSFNKAEYGVLDLTNTDFQNGKVPLNGDWEFYWEEILSPNDIEYYSNEVVYQYLPEFWKNYPQNYSRKGYCTYRLFVVLSPQQQEESLTLHLNNLHSAYSLYFNGVLRNVNGQVGESFEESKPKWLPQYVDLYDLRDTNEIIINVSSFRHRNGGVHDSVYLGYSKYFHSLHRRQLFSEVFLGGCCFILGCFFIGLFFFWKKDRAALNFGLFTIAFTVRVLFVGSRSIIEVFPNFSWGVAIRCEYLSMFFMHYFLFHFIFHAFPKYTSKIYAVILKSITAIFLLVCLLPNDYFTYLTIPNNYFLIVSFIYGTQIFYRAYKAQEPGAVWAIFGLIMFFLNTVPLVLEYASIMVMDPLITNVIYILFIFLISLVFASRFGLAFFNVEKLKEAAVYKNQQIQKKNEEIQHTNQLINDSINYAERIQKSLLPSKRKLKNQFGKCSLYFRPQGTVSGDFYWSYKGEGEDENYLAIVDCTGHGVPGAFVSLIGINTLDNILNAGILEPNEILSELNEVIYNRLQKKDDDLEEVKDGMDISLCKVNRRDRTIVYSAAHHKLVIFKTDGSMEVYKGQNHNIGSVMPFDFKFENKVLRLGKGDRVFLFTDGVYDQKGGRDRKKLYPKRLYDFLQSTNHLSVDEQIEEFERFINEWKGNTAQLDDILLFGLEFD